MSFDCGMQDRCAPIKVDTVTCLNTTSIDTDFSICCALNDTVSAELPPLSANALNLVLRSGEVQTVGHSGLIELNEVGDNGGTFKGVLQLSNIYFWSLG